MQDGLERYLSLRIFTQESSNISSFSIKGLNLQVHVSMFRSRSSVPDFYNIIKYSHCNFEVNSNQNIFYLDDMVLMSQTINGLEIVRDTLIFLLHSLGFVINLQKYVLVSLQRIEFLELEID